MGPNSRKQASDSSRRSLCANNHDYSGLTPGGKDFICRELRLTSKLTFHRDELSQKLPDDKKDVWYDERRSVMATLGQHAFAHERWVAQVDCTQSTCVAKPQEVAIKISTQEVVRRPLHIQRISREHASQAASCACGTQVADDGNLCHRECHNDPTLYESPRLDQTEVVKSMPLIIKRTSSPP